MFNLLQTDADDFQFMLDSVGEEVKVNGTTVKALITNTSLTSNYDDKKVTTLQSIKRGDMINYRNGDWLIISEVNGQRYNKYKAIMRKCNCSFQVQTGTVQTLKGYDSMGRPVYETTPVYVTAKGIADVLWLSVTDSQQINLQQGQIFVTVQDNQDTQKIALGNTFTLMGETWKVDGINKTKVGLFVLTCSKSV
jgi:hypothetical protein